MASDMRKPMGITVLRKQEVPSKLWPLPITDMWGIGKKSVPLLEERGIHTIGDLADPSNETMLMTLLGKQGYMAIQHARGNGSNRLSYNTSVQSISQSTTLDRDIIEYDEVKTVFRRLAHSLSQRAKQEKNSKVLYYPFLFDIMILPMLFAHSLYKAIRMRKPFYWKQHCYCLIKITTVKKSVILESD
mgnify:CR=1 FL=1